MVKFSVLQLSMLLFFLARLVDAAAPEISFEKLQLTDRYYCDGIDAGDIDGDGHLDVVAGPFWYEGPKFQTGHEFYPAVPLPPEVSPSNSMFSFVHDFSGNGRPDILVLGRVHKHSAYWYENPADSNRLWEKHYAFERVKGESPALVNMFGNASRQLICHWEGRWGWIEPVAKKPRKPWKFVAIGDNEDWPQFYHGEGVGDINGDKRLDFIINDGWYEQPNKSNPQWEFHRRKFSTERGGAQIFAYDVDADGDNDVISAIDGHGWGLAWFEQFKKNDGTIDFRQHLIMGDRGEEKKFGVAFSQPHALAIADIDGDGRQDIVCGKRRWAHGPEGDIEPDAAPVLYWFQLTHPEKGKARFIPHLIDDHSGVGVQITVKDVNKDNRPDILTASKLGTFVFLNQTKKVTRNSKLDYSPKILQAGETLNDTRLGPLRGERGDFLLKPAQTYADAQTRALHVRRVMLVSMGLWPLPERTPLNATVHGRLDMGDYTIEKVYFESIPGFYVTGNLYRPKGAGNCRPAVLSPHGHFPGGRFQDEGEKTVQQKIASRAEKFKDGGRSFMQSRCVQLARMGCVVFHYDMVGYGDCQQISLETAHRFSGSRKKFNTPPEAGFYSPSALLNQNNQLGLHTWNSICALDFLTHLPDVDPNRIAVTGGSGGGTQTFMLCAVDDRPLVSVPVVIVSADRQGGCTCENICGFRIDTHNLDFTALHAPKPLLLISADDATRTMTTRGFPELHQHYGIFGAGKNVEHVSLLQFPHNYNYVSRAAMYQFVNQHLELGLGNPIVEGPYKLLTKNELSVWAEDHPAPEFEPGFERKLLDQINHAARKQLEDLTPHDAHSLENYREVVGSAWDILLRGLPSEPKLRFEKKSTKDLGKYQRTLGLLSYSTFESQRAKLPVIQLSKKNSAARTVIWIDKAGKTSLFNKDGTLDTDVERLLTNGRNVIGVDLLGQGEFLTGKQNSGLQRSLPGEEGYGGWTYCYNLPVFARRVHDILAVIEFVKQNSESCPVDIIGLNEVGPLVAATLVQSPGMIDRAAIDTHGFRFSQLTNIYDINFLPGAVRYGDLPGLLSLASPKNLWLAGEQPTKSSVIAAAWCASGKSNRLTFASGKKSESDAVTWLLR